MQYLCHIRDRKLEYSCQSITDVEKGFSYGIILFQVSSNLTKVRPLFTLSHRGYDNSPLLIVFSAYDIDQSIVPFM